jgi:polysaccharide biosynthesis transport protein
VSLSQVLYILWRRVWIVALTFICALVVAGGVLLLVPGRYDAEATASIDPGSVNPVTDSVGSTGAIGLMQGNLIELVQSHRVALDVVRRLNLTTSPQVQAIFRASKSFGLESIDDWMADSILLGVDPKFQIGTNVLTIKYKASDPNQAALIANAFLASTIDASIAMKAAAGDQTANWFAPQLQDLRKDLLAARTALEQFQAKTNVVAPNAGGDTEAAALAAVTQDLATNRALLTALQTRLASGSTELANDPSDPDLQMINSLKEKISGAQAEIEAVKNTLGANNPKMVSAVANLTTLRKQLVDATERAREHLKNKIANTQNQIATLVVAQEQAQKTLIAAQAQRDRLGDLQRDVAFKLDELNARERAAAQARLQSKLTFADIAVLDKATAPISPAFPKPTMVIPAALGGGLTLGMILALIAESTDRRIRFPADFSIATSAPMLGVIDASKRGRAFGAGRRRGLLAAT